MDDEDAVVHETPVYLCKTLSESLYLTQYTARPSALSYSQDNITQVRVKPGQKKLELTLHRDPRILSYDRSKGRQFAVNTDGKTTEADNNYFNSDYMDKEVLMSHGSISDVSRYCVGRMVDGELHMTPLSALLHMRPLFTYLDKSDSRGKQDENGVEDDERADEPAAAVTVKFTHNTDKLKRAQEKSYKYQMAKSEEEAWISAELTHNTSTASHFQYEQLVCRNTDESSSASQLTKTEYLATLIPSEGSESKDTTSHQTLPQLTLRKLPLPDQVKRIMINVNIVQFSKLHELIGEDIESTALLRTVQHTATLVQGNWILLSSVLYEESKTADTLIWARDHMLGLFTEHTYINRQELIQQTRLPADEVTALLSSVAVCEKPLGWKLKYPRDDNFISRFPDIEQRYKMLWSKKTKQLAEGVKVKVEPPATSWAKKPRRRNSSVRSMSSDGEEDGKQRRRNSSGKADSGR